MRISKLDFEKIGSFSPLFKDYISGEETIRELYNHPPNQDGIYKAATERSFDASKRSILHEAIDKQYTNLNKSAAVSANINSLTNENTFTITTGHQLNIFTGPLYFIFKIVTVINTCRKLKEEHPEFHFVPVYWMASEDHDFEEISYFHLFGKKYTWNTDQKGPVGKFDPTGLDQVLEELPEKIELFQQAYQNHNTLAEAVSYYVNELFGQEGLVIIDGDQASLKQLFIPEIKSEIFDQISFKETSKTNQTITELGYKSQAFSREINFFYMKDGSRERIIWEQGNYVVNNTSLSFSKEELTHEIESNPERFSPNVITRPLYQEIILPNIAYCGGPAEIAYWLQLKSAFRKHQIPFPVLLPRSFGMIINKGMNKKIEKLGLSESTLFLETDEIIHQYLNATTDGEHLLDDEKNKLSEIMKSISDKAGKIDKSLEGFVGAQSSKIDKEIVNIEKRLKKSIEQKNEVALKQIEAIKEKLFPDGRLQERHENFLNYYINNRNFISQLLDSFDPLDHQFHIIWET